MVEETKQTYWMLSYLRYGFTWYSPLPTSPAAIVLYSLWVETFLSSPSSRPLEWFCDQATRGTQTFHCTSSPWSATVVLIVGYALKIPGAAWEEGWAFKIYPCLHPNHRNLNLIALQWNPGNGIFKYLTQGFFCEPGCPFTYFPLFLMAIAEHL